MNKLKVDNHTLFFAFRYALGRSTFAPSIVIDDILNNVKSISTTDINLYIKEISECSYYGNMDSDKETWLYLKNKLQEELNIR